MKFDNSPIDYTASDASAAPLVDGLYTGTIADETELCETSSGNAGIKVKVRLTEGPNGAVNRQLTDTVGFSAAAAFKIAQLADSAGVSRPVEVSEAAANSFIAALKGAEVHVKVKNGTYTNGGVTKDTVKIESYVTSNSDAQATPITAAGGRRRR